MTDSMNTPPRRYKPPPGSENSDCRAAWKALLEEQGYPMTCTEVVCYGYFSAGWEAARRQGSTRSRRKIPKMPEG